MLTNSFPSCDTIVYCPLKMTILGCVAPPHHLEAARRRRAIAISSQQYKAQQEQKRVVTLHTQSSPAGNHSISLQQARAASSTPPGGNASSLLKRRAQIKADVMDETVEALDILRDQQQNPSSPGQSPLPSSSLPSSPPGDEETHWGRMPAPLALEDVAVMKAQRREGQLFSLLYTRQTQLTLLCSGQ